MEERVYRRLPFVNALASANHRSTDTTDAATLQKVLDFTGADLASIQIKWTGLTGVINATVQIQASNIGGDDDADWYDKTGGLLTLSGANSTTGFSFNGNITEEFYRLKYTANGVTGGVINAIAFGKPG